MEVKLDACFGEKQINDIMHSVDMFEETKQLGTFHTLTITGKPNLNKLIDNTKIALEKSGKNVLFLSIRSVDEVSNHTIPPYICHNVSTITTGEKWYMFNQELTRLGYDVSTSSNMCVESVKFGKSLNT